MTTTDKLTRITKLLIGEISILPGIDLSPESQAQLTQLITDAFEQVGLLAIDEYEAWGTEEIADLRTHDSRELPDWKTPSSRGD